MKTCKFLLALSLSLILAVTLLPVTAVLGSEIQTEFIASVDYAKQITMVNSVANGTMGPEWFYESCLHYYNGEQADAWSYLKFDKANQYWVNSVVERYGRVDAKTSIPEGGWNNELGVPTFDGQFLAGSSTYYTSRTFIAPYSGDISITSNGQVKTLAANTWEIDVNLKIEKNGVKVWPLSEDWFLMEYYTTLAFNFDPLALSVSAGDTIRFIVERDARRYSDQVEWDPIINYTEVTAASEVIYSDNFTSDTISPAWTTDGGYPASTGGKLVIDGGIDTSGVTIGNNTVHKNYKVSVDVCAARFKDGNDKWGPSMTVNNDSVSYEITVYDNKLEIKKGGVWFAAVGRTFLENTIYHFEIQCINKTLVVTVDGEMLALQTLTGDFSTYFRMGAYQSAAEYDNFVISGVPDEYVVDLEIAEPDNGESAATASVVNSFGAPAIARLILGLYEADGTLIDVAMSTEKTAYYGKAQIDMDAAVLAVPASGQYLKAFLFDSLNSLTPYCPAERYPEID